MKVHITLVDPEGKTERKGIVEWGRGPVRPSILEEGALYYATSSWFDDEGEFHVIYQKVSPLRWVSG